MGVGILVLGWGLFSLGTNMDNYGDIDDHDDGMMEQYEMAPAEVVRKIQGGEDLVLLDVRTPEEYEEVHLENSLLLPVESMSQQTLNEIGLGQNAKDKEIIIYCRSGARSRMAYNLMSSLGYTNIKSISGGMVHWQEDSYPHTEVGPYMGMMDFDSDSNVSVEGASINFDREVHDFGQIAQLGGVVRTEFTVSNSGSETLEIGEISTSCGCTTAEISNKEIEVGEKATLTVYFDPNFHEEPQEEIIRTVFIPTNDSARGEVEVKIRVDILENQ